MKFININYIFLVPKHWNVCSIMLNSWVVGDLRCPNANVTSL